MMSPIGSPPCSRGFTTFSLAPISRRVSNNPVLSGFRPMALRVMRDPGTSRAATSGKAAEDGSPGTMMSAARSSGWPASWMWRLLPCRLTVTAAPKWRSMFSE
jgi:hypothetical protein